MACYGTGAPSGISSDPRRSTMSPTRQGAEHLGQVAAGSDAPNRHPLGLALAYPNDQRPLDCGHHCRDWHRDRAFAGRQAR
jgi:hypothetical protein